VLLSFAQFEREVTGERIRDKIAASKKRGIWMGGVVPLGYRVQDRALHIVDGHAEIVRDLFRRYLEIGSVVRLQAVVDAQNVLPTRSDRRDRQDDGRRARQSRAPPPDPLEPDLCWTAQPQEAGSRRTTRRDHRPVDLGSRPEPIG